MAVSLGLVMSGDDDAAAGRRWLLLRREQGIAVTDEGGARFSLDHLFVDQDGIPTLVEVKRAADTRARREVVAQMLDYAANARFLQAPELRTAFAAVHSNPDAAIRDALGQDVDPDELWERAGANLEQGKLRLVFLADRIPSELRTLVEFLNEQLRTMEVLAIEVSTFEADGTRVLRARTIGLTQAAQAVKGRSSARSWDVDDWLAEVAPAFPTRTGKRRTRHNLLQRVVAPTVRRINEIRADEGSPPFPRITNHTFRRTYISLLFAVGADPPYVMSQVGHEDAKTTLNIYAQVLRGRDRTHVGEAFDRLGQRYDGPSGDPGPGSAR